MKKIFLALFISILALSACSGDEVDPNDLEQEAASEEGNSEKTPEESDTTEAPDTDGANSSEENSEDSEKDNEGTDEATGSNGAEEESKSSNDEESEEGSESTDEESSESQSSEDSQEEQTASVGLKAYMPDGPMTKTFLQGEYEGVHEIVDVKGPYVQRVITIGDMVTMEVLEYTEGTISVVYEESNPEDVSAQLESFEPIESSEVLVDMTGNDSDGDTWTVLDKKQTTETKVGEFKDVFVVKRDSTGEASGVKTTLIQYYAPGYGLIKEQMEEHGDDGYKVNTELTELDK